MSSSMSASAGAGAGACWRVGGDAGLSVEQCARLMNHNFGVAIEAKHYDRGIYADLKRDGMEKWERFVDKMLA